MIIGVSHPPKKNYFFSISISPKNKKNWLKKCQKKFPRPQKNVNKLFFSISISNKKKLNWLNKFQKKLPPPKKSPHPKKISKNYFFNLKIFKKIGPPPKKIPPPQKNFKNYFFSILISAVNQKNDLKISKKLFFLNFNFA